MRPTNTVEHRIGALGVGRSDNVAVTVKFEKQLVYALAELRRKSALLKS